MNTFIYSWYIMKKIRFIIITIHKLYEKWGTRKNNNIYSNIKQFT